MEKLFGVPVDQLMVTLFRRAQSVLIVGGLVLATMLFPAAFTTGETLTHSVRVLVVRAVYTIIASAVGSLLVVVIGLGMMGIVGFALAGEDFAIVFDFQWRSVGIAYTLTFIVVLISSWRVSRLNIVRAIRDITEPSLGLIFSILLPILGLILVYTGYQGAQATFWTLGSSLVIISVLLVARRLGLADRVAYSLAGIGLVVWWMLPFDALDAVLPNMEQDITTFFLSVMILVIGLVIILLGVTAFVAEYIRMRRQ